MDGLSAQFTVDRGSFVLDSAFVAAPRGVTSLFGPSGSGKSTLLRCIAGLERTGRGRCALNGTVWQDDTAGVFVPPEGRGIGYVFQEPSLFPHLTVRQNLRFGAKRASRERRRVAFDDAVAWLGIAPLLDRRPDALSGGERQRTAIARALLSGPRLLLLDEPLSAVDHASRRGILDMLERLVDHLAVPVVHVSHDLREVARLADRVVWLENGRIRATGTATEVLSSDDLADAGGEAVGAIVEAVVSQHDDEFALTELRAPCGPLFVRRIDRAIDAPVRVQILARDVSIALARESASSLLNQVECRVAELHAAGPGQTLVRLLAGPDDEAVTLLARITRKSATALGLAPGMPVVARAKSVGLMG